MNDHHLSLSLFMFFCWAGAFLLSRFAVFYCRGGKRCPLAYLYTRYCNHQHHFTAIIIICSWGKKNATRTPPISIIIISSGNSIEWGHLFTGTLFLLNDGVFFYTLLNRIQAAKVLQIYSTCGCCWLVVAQIDIKTCCSLLWKQNKKQPLKWPSSLFASLLRLLLFNLYAS